MCVKGVKELKFAFVQWLGAMARSNMVEETFGSIFVE